MNLRKVNGLFFVFGFVLIVFLLSFGSSVYTSSNLGKSFIDMGQHSAFAGDLSKFKFDPDVCQKGQDFIIQVAPFGCTPAVVRSDLLEEQDVPIFCPIQAIKLNPFIDIEAISSIGFGSEYPREVRRVSFVPAYDALTGKGVLNNMRGDNIGYAAIVLRRNANESSMPKWVSGNLSATIRYDLKEAYGIKDHYFYLPEMNDQEFDKKYGQYSFYNGLGYLRAEDVGPDSASIIVYSGKYERSLGGNREGDVKRQKIWGDRLSSSNPDSSTIYLPGLGCYSYTNIILQGIDYPDTTARLSINSEIVELRVGEKFLDNKCRIMGEPYRAGLRQNVKISCQVDEGDGSLNLWLVPKVRLGINEVEKDYEIGEKLFEITVDDKIEDVYLAYAGTKGDTMDKDDLVVYLSKHPRRDGEVNLKKLDSNALKTASDVAEFELGNLNTISDVGNYFLTKGGQFASWFILGKSFQKIEYKYKSSSERADNEEKLKDIFQKEVKVIGFSAGENQLLNNEIGDYYNKAKADYLLIDQLYSIEKYPDTSFITLGEEGLNDLIILSSKLNQRADAREFCSKFEEYYPDSKLDSKFICNKIFIMSDSPNSATVLISGRYKEIRFDGVHQPDYYEHGVELVIKNIAGQTKVVKLRMGQTVDLNQLFGISVVDRTSNEYIKFEKAKDDNVATFYLDVKDKTTLQTVASFIRKSENFEKDISESYGDFTFTLREVNLKRVAKVKVQAPSIRNAYTTAEFPFKIGIEKRGIKLSPEKTKELIGNLDKLIKQWTDISDGLGTTVETLKGACLGMNLFLIAKNLLATSGVKSTARQDVMRGEGGWYSFCDSQVGKDKPYSSRQECLVKNSDKIEKQVDLMAAKMEKINDNFKGLYEGNPDLLQEGLLGDKVVNQKKLAGLYVEDLRKRGFCTGNNEEVSNPYSESEKINCDDLIRDLATDRFDDRVYNLEDLKEMDLYSSLANDKSLSEEDRKIFEKRLYTTASNIRTNSKNIISYHGFASEYGADGCAYVGTLGETKEKELPATKKVTLSQSRKIGTISNRQEIIDSAGKDNYAFFYKNSLDEREYLIVYDDDGVVKKTYEFEEAMSGGTQVTKLTPLESNQFNVRIKSYDASHYYHEIKSPEVKYYDKEPYAGLPALVPFDVKNGWYAYIKQNMPSFGTTRSYDDSGRINSFWLCNVGANGQVDFNLPNRDDTCELINLGTGQALNQFPGLDASASKRLVDQAIRAIYDASRSYKDNVKSANILGSRVKVGLPEIGLSNIECTDVMSVTECRILFNVCDPVVCPSSRCDLGGAYPVRDVIGSGLIGSLVLCLPNWNEGIYLPICLTGVKAGLDGLLSVAKSYRGCLQESLDSGRTIGICDEINSVYMCEFIWRQALPIAQAAIPNVINWLSSSSPKGGAEYLSGEAAWDNAQKSMDFFKENYAVSMFEAFKSRSQESVGTELCKNFVSVVYPTSAGSLKTFLKSDSPPQFTGKFESIPFSSVTNPPLNHYKVFYHIYAGDDKGAYYNVYLRGGSGSYFQDTSFGRNVASGYIDAGGYKTETKDFTAPEGYKELCINVNNIEECGFGIISSDFAVNYMTDQYVKDHINDKDIKTEEECISGKSHGLALLNTNIQEGADNFIDPNIYERGIIRICASDNPGKASDPYYGQDGQRWVEVGYCGDKQFKCYLDTHSVDDAVNFKITAEESLVDIRRDLRDGLKISGDFMSEESFEELLAELSNMVSSVDKAKRINDEISKIFESNKKAYLIFLEGGVYRDLALAACAKVDCSRIPFDEVDEVDEDKWDVGDIKDDSLFSDFISNRFEYQDGTPSANMCFQYYKGIWIWKLTCDPLDDPFNLLFGWKTVSESKNDKDLENIQKYFFGGLGGKNYDSGLKVLMDRVEENKDGYLWIDSNLVSGEVDYNPNKIFNYKNNYYFRFGYKGWEWSQNKDDWFPVYLKYRSIMLDGMEMDVETGGIEDIHSLEISDEFYNIQSSLVDKDFISGAKIIFTLGKGNIKLKGEEKLPLSYSSAENRKKVLDQMAEMVGGIVDSSELCKIDIGQNVASCFSALVHVYNLAGVDFESNLNRVYAAGPDAVLKDGSKLGSISDYVGRAIHPEYTEKEKLSLLKSGDQIDIVYYSGGSWKFHSVIFVNWVNSQTHMANVFDWNGKEIAVGTGDRNNAVCVKSMTRNGVCKIYRYNRISLKDEDNFVYHIRQFKESKEVKVTGTPDLSSVEIQKKKLEIEGAYKDISKLEGDFNDGNNEEVIRKHCGENKAFTEEECNEMDSNVLSFGEWDISEILELLVDKYVDLGFKESDLKEGGDSSGSDGLTDDKPKGSIVSGKYELNDWSNVYADLTKAVNSRARQSQANPDLWAESIKIAMEESNMLNKKEYAALILSVIETESSFSPDPLAFKKGSLDEIMLGEAKDLELIYWAGNEVYGWFGSDIESFVEENKAELETIVTERQYDDFITDNDPPGDNDKYRPKSIGPMQLKVENGIKMAIKYNGKSFNDEMMRNKLYTIDDGIRYGTYYLNEIIKVYTDGYNEKVTPKMIRYIAADYNSGIYSSRNAAIQKKLNDLTDSSLILDGDLGEETRKVIFDFLDNEGKNYLGADVSNFLAAEKKSLLETKQIYKLINEKCLEKSSCYKGYAFVPEIEVSSAKGYSLTISQHVEKVLFKYNEFCKSLKC